MAIWCMCSSWWYLRLQTHTHNTVHVQFMVIPKATDTHSQYVTYTVHADTSGYRHTLTIYQTHSSPPQQQLPNAPQRYAISTLAVCCCHSAVRCRLLIWTVIGLERCSVMFTDWGGGGADWLGIRRARGEISVELVTCKTSSLNAKV